MNQATASNPAAPAENAYTYFAFISYKRADEKWARWLKRQLQLYRLPAKTHKKHPGLKRRCSPVFLDKTNLMPGELDSGLSSEVQSAKYLIVICSRAAKENSKYLDDELKYFLEGGGDTTRVIPFIVDESAHPVEECFPNYLAELCKEKNIVGVSIYDDGKRSALLRIVAAMLGIKREELESDDLRRRRRQAFAAAILAVMLIAGGWKCWDYFVPKEKYYLDYTEVYGVPVGIRELSSKDIKSMHAHYTIKSSRNKVDELRYENSAGTMILPMKLGLIERFSKAVYSYEDARLSQIRLFDEKNKLIVEKHYASPNTIDLMKNIEADGQTISSAAPMSSRITASLLDSQTQEQKSNVTRYFVIYDDAGFTREVHYCLNTLNHFAQDSDGISGIRYERDEHGRVTRLYYLTFTGAFNTNATKVNNYSVIGKRNGEAGMSFLYDSSGDCIEFHILNADGGLISIPSYGAVIKDEYSNHNITKQTYQDEHQNPFLNDRRFTGWKSVFDDRGNEIRRSYFGTDGKPIFHKDGFAGYEAVYDERGNQIKVSYFGTDGKPTLHKDGNAGLDAVYDERGNLIKVSYFGTDGKPTLHKAGNAGYEAVYDKRGNLIKLSYFGMDGEPVLSKEGYAGWEAVFDEQGHQTKCSFLGLDGTLTSNKDGIAVFYSEYDDYGNRIGNSFFDTDGLPTANKDGYSSWRAIFDEHGNQIQVSYYNTDGSLVLSPEGIAGWKSVYDKNGNEIKRSYFGTDGKPALYKAGNAGWDAVYDEHGNKIKVNYFGTDGEPVLHKDGNAGWDAVYDERGNQTKVSYFGTDGLPVLIDNGFAGCENEFDERGNKVKISYFGVEGELILRKEGYAILEQEYDERGQCTFQRWYGTDGRPILREGLYAAADVEYDDRGNRIRASRYDTEGHYTNGNDTYPTWTAANDERGNEIKHSYFGTDGKPVLVANGYASWEAVYDSSNHIYEKRYYDSAGRLLLSTDRTTNVTITNHDDNSITASFSYSDGTIVEQYDGSRNLVMLSFFGIDGKPDLLYSGYSSWKADYDERGNQIKRSYFGTDSMPVFVDSFGFSSVEYQYDTVGNRIGRICYDEHGNIIEK